MAIILLRPVLGEKSEEDGMRKCTIVLSVFLCAFAAQAQNGMLQKMLNTVSTDSLMSYDRTLERAAGTYSRVCYTPGNDSAVQYILRMLKKNPEVALAGLDTFYVDTANPPYNRQPLANVFGIIHGKKDTSIAIVIGAHLDSFAGHDSTWPTHWQTIRAPGADDNGTGVAAILEMARIFGNGSSFGFVPDYSIILVSFNAEEAGIVYDHWLYGAVHFVQRLKSRGYAVAAMISIDMVGDNTQLATDAVTNDASKYIADRAVLMNNQYGLGLQMNGPSFVYATYSDHASFWDAGYPAILLVEHAPPNQSSAIYAANRLYHTSDDTSGAINPELFRRSTQLTLATAASFALPSSATDVRTTSTEVPLSSVLGQNYPNPFNPTTRIPFTVASAQHVKIIVYDVLGRERATLLDQPMAPGSYAVDWNAKAMESGVYFCRMTGETMSSVMKLIVNK
jgi:hypothetical protein